MRRTALAVAALLLAASQALAAGAFVTRTVQDGSGAHLQSYYDESGAGTGPFDPVYQLPNGTSLGGGGSGGAVYGPTAVGAAATQPPVALGYVDGSGKIQQVSPSFALPTVDQNAAQTITTPGTSASKVQGVQFATGGIPFPVSLIDGADTTLGSKADAASAAASASLMARVFQLHSDLVGPTPAAQAGPALGPAAALGVVQQDGQTTTLTGSAAGALTNGTYATGAIPTAGYQSFGVQITGVGTGNTWTYEGSNDNTTWYAVDGYTTPNIGSTAPSTTANTAELRQFPLTFSYFRIRIFTYGSGTVTAVVTMKVTPVAPIATYSTLASGSGVTAIANSSAIAGGVASLSRLVSAAATTNATNVKTSTGRVYKVYACNTTTSARYIRLFNKATAPVPGTDAPFWSRALPPSSASGVPLCQSFDAADIGYYLSAGIGYDITAAAPDLDATALAAGDVTQVSVEYQ